MGDHTAAETGVFTVRFDETTAGFENSLGYYLIDAETGAITDVGMIFDSSRGVSPGDTFSFEVPAGSRIGTFLIANGGRQNDLDALDPGGFRFVDRDSGAPASLNSTAPRLEHVAADGTVTAIRGDIWHSAGFGENVALNRDNEVHLRGMETNPDGSWTFGWEDLAAPNWDQDFTDVVMTVSLDGAGLEFVNPAFAAVVPCFVAGTLIASEAGPRPVETLRAGDRVLTRDHGFRPLVWVGRRRLSAAALRGRSRFRPVRIEADAFGPGMPARPLQVSPQHRMLLIGAGAELLFGRHEVLVSALHLLGLPGVSRPAPDAVDYVHLLFDTHEIVCAEGMWSESYQPGVASVAGLDTAQRRELLALFPELARGRRPFAAARPALRAREVALLMAPGASGQAGAVPATAMDWAARTPA